MYYRIFYNVTGRSHDSTFDDFWSSNSGANAFKKALEETKKANPGVDIDSFWAFYIIPCRKGGHMPLKLDKRKFHGWDMGGKISYPTDR